RLLHGLDSGFLNRLCALNERCNVLTSLSSRTERLHLNVKEFCIGDCLLSSRVSLHSTRYRGFVSLGLSFCGFSSLLLGDQGSQGVGNALEGVLQFLIHLDLLILSRASAARMSITRLSCRVNLLHRLHELATSAGGNHHVYASIGVVGVEPVNNEILSAFRVL